MIASREKLARRFPRLPGFKPPNDRLSLELLFQRCCARGQAVGPTFNFNLAYLDSMKVAICPTGPRRSPLGLIDVMVLATERFKSVSGGYLLANDTQSITAPKVIPSPPVTAMSSSSRASRGNLAPEEKARLICGSQ